MQGHAVGLGQEPQPMAMDEGGAVADRMGEERLAADAGAPLTQEQQQLLQQHTEGKAHQQTAEGQEAGASALPIEMSSTGGVVAY